MTVSAKVVRDAPEASLFTRRFCVLLITQTLFGLSFSTFFLLPKFLAQVLSANELVIGQLGACSTIAGVVAFPFVGALNDRYGRRPFVLLGSAMLTLSAFAMLLVHEVGPGLYALRVVHGLSFALLFNSATTLVSDGVRGDRMGQALSVFGASLLATHALAPALAESIAAHAGWSTVFLCAGCAGALSFVSGLLVADGHSRAVDRPRESAFLQLLRQPAVRKIVFVIGAAGAGFGTVFTFHQPYALSLGIERVSGFFIAYALSAVATRLGFVTRIAKEKRIRATGLAMLGYAAAVALTAALSPSVLVVVGSVMGLAQGVFYPLYNAAAVESVTPAQRGSMMALYHGGFNFGISLALSLGGALAAKTGFPLLFVAVALIVATASLSLLRGPSPAAG